MVAKSMFGVMYVAFSLMIAVLVSTVLLTPTGRAAVAMSRAQSYMSSALE